MACMGTTRANLTIDEDALADARDIAAAQKMSLSEYVSKALIAANMASAERAAAELTQQFGDQLDRFDDLATAGLTAPTRLDGKAGNAA